MPSANGFLPARESKDVEGQRFLHVLYIRQYVFLTAICTPLKDILTSVCIKL